MQEGGGGGAGGLRSSRPNAASSALPAMFYRAPQGQTPYPARVPTHSAPAPVYHAPPPPAQPHFSAPAPSYSAPAPQQHYSSGNTVGSNAQGRISPIAPPPPAAPPAPPPESIDQWLAGDTTYQHQEDAAHQAARDYLAQMTNQQNQYQGDYVKNLANLGDQQTQADSNLQDDYASRGLSQSGLMVKALSDLKTQYDKQQSDLASGRASFIQNLQSGLTNFNSTNNLQQQQYRQDAINRRATQYGA